MVTASRGRCSSAEPFRAKRTRQGAPRRHVRQARGQARRPTFGFTGAGSLEPRRRPHLGVGRTVPGDDCSKAAGYDPSKSAAMGAGEDMTEWNLTCVPDDPRYGRKEQNAGSPRVDDGELLLRRISVSDFRAAAGDGCPKWSSRDSDAQSQVLTQ